ncbi:hypothetical protein ROSINTL182_08873 [Roseburia intestinalis L1-82]|uniref:Uncharacterized protein n=1 Tax=Roseburia intestinalis L1-82 TaxID=536231 RepID=C7GG13_9FIRM|nr:hypothetical protein ROSINTL182_08873 [Roseburia intestinalis L1-82]
MCAIFTLFIIQEDTITCQVKKNREIIFSQFSFPIRYFILL